jgi:hypothetical protein
MATNYKPTYGFGTIGEGSLKSKPTKKERAAAAVKRIDKSRKDRKAAYEKGKKGYVYGTPGQGFKMVKPDYKTSDKPATVDNMSITWIKENMKNKPLTKKATGGVSNTKSKAKSSKKGNARGNYQNEGITGNKALDYGILAVVHAIHAGEKVVSGIDYATRKAAKGIKKGIKATEDTAKHIDKKLQPYRIPEKIKGALSKKTGTGRKSKVPSIANSSKKFGDSGPKYSKGGITKTRLKKK